MIPLKSSLAAELCLEAALPSPTGELRGVEDMGEGEYLDLQGVRCWVRSERGTGRRRAAVVVPVRCRVG